MSLGLILTGFVIGFCVAAPVGPIGILCIHRTFSYGFPSGISSGLGAALADTFYGAVAAFGLTFISSFLMDHMTFIRFAGGILLLFIGIRTFKAKPPSNSEDEEVHINLYRDAISTFVLTSTSPMTIMAFLTLFAGMGLTFPPGNFLLPSITVIGIFSGSCFWWLALCGFVGIFKARFNDSLLVWVNRFSGGTIFVCGIALLLEHNLKLVDRLTLYIHSF